MKKKSRIIQSHFKRFSQKSSLFKLDTHFSLEDFHHFFPLKIAY